MLFDLTKSHPILQLQYSQFHGSQNAVLVKPTNPRTAGWVGALDTPKKNQIIFKSDIISQSDLIASSPGYDVKLDCSMWFFFRGAWHFCINVSTCLYVKPKERYKTETVLSVQTSSSSNLPTLALARTNVNLPHLRTYEILKSSTYWIIEHRMHFSCFDTQRYLVDRAELRQPPSNQHSNVPCDQRSFPRLTKGSRSHAFKASSSLTMSLGSKSWRLPGKTVKMDHIWRYMLLGDTSSLLGPASASPKKSSSNWTIGFLPNWTILIVKFGAFCEFEEKSGWFCQAHVIKSNKYLSLKSFIKSQTAHYWNQRYTFG